MAPSPVDELSLIDLERGSNKGASKQRRDQINAEIAVMRDLLPLPESARQRLSQLQIMSLSCVFIRKCNVLKKLMKNTCSTPTDIPCEFSQSLTGFLLVTTREGKLIYISENVTEYLGHSMVDMKTQGDSLFDIVDKRDHATVQAQLLQGSAETNTIKQQSFFCRMNMSRTLKRQAGFGDVKVMHVRGRFMTIPGEDLASEQQVFMAVCSPLITPDVKDTLIQNNTMVFKSVHKLDMNFIEITQNGEFHLAMSNEDIADKSWYSMLHPEDIIEAREKHIQLIKSRHEMGCMMTVRMMTATNDVIWVNIVMHVRQALMANSDEPVILCINQVISEQEAYHFKVQGHLFALYAPRTPDFIFGSAFCAPIPAAIDGNPLPPKAAAFVPSPFFKNQTNIDSFQTSPTPQHYSQEQIISNQQTVCLKNGVVAQAGLQQGHSNTLKALKRKLQENVTTSCKPSKMARLVKETHNCGFMKTSPPTPMSSLPYASQGYKGFQEGPMGSLAPQIVAGGPVQMYCQEPVYRADPLQMKQGKPTNVAKPMTKMHSLEQVVPEVIMPQSYLTPDPSPSSSPEPVIKQEGISTSKVVDPVVVARHLCSLKKRQIETKTHEKKSKNLPSLDVSFVDSFFDQICEVSDKITDVQTPMQASIIVKEEPLDNFHVDCLQRQMTQQDARFSNIDIDDLLGLSRSDMPESPSSCVSSEGVRDNDEQILPMCENQPSPIASIKSVDEKFSCDDVLSMIAMTPESEFGTETSEDMMDPENWLLESCTVNGFEMMMSGSYNIQDTILKSSIPHKHKGDKLCYLKQHISSWTPSGVLKSVEDSQ